jgi:transposase-like protein
MNIHKNARLTFARRLEMVLDVVERKLTLAAAAAAHGVSVPTARKWVGRYLTQGQPGLRDASSRPRVSPRAIAPRLALAIVELRRRFLTQARIVQSLGVSQSTVGRVLARAGLSRWSDLMPSEPTVRYEHAHPGELLHIDTKKLGRIVRMGHRVTGDPRDSVDGAGYEFLFVAVDDHARIGFTQMKPNERKGSAIAFLRRSVAYFSGLGVRIKRVLTDNGSAVSLEALRHRLPQTRPPPRLHPSLSAANQRQGRALHPIRAARMGLRHPLSPFLRAHRDARALEPSLQLASSSPRHRRYRAHGSPHPNQKQPLDAPQLGHT